MSTYQFVHSIAMVQCSISSDAIVYFLQSDELSINYVFHFDNSNNVCLSMFCLCVRVIFSFMFHVLHRYTIQPPSPNPILLANDMWDIHDGINRGSITNSNKFWLVSYEMILFVISRRFFLYRRKITFMPTKALKHSFLRSSVFQLRIFLDSKRIRL